MAVLSRAALVLLLGLGACGGDVQEDAVVFFDLFYLDDCGCAFEDFDLSQGATAGAFIEDATTFEVLSETCDEIPAAPDNSLFDIEPVLRDRALVIEGVARINVFVSVFSPPLPLTEVCSDRFDDATVLSLFGEALNVPLTGVDTFVPIDMSCAGLAVTCNN